MKLTSERVGDFRSTLKEIVNLKNGNVPKDFNEIRSDGSNRQPLKKTLEFNKNLEILQTSS